MHICEALIAAYSATKENKYLERAQHLANRFCFELAKPSLGLVYEHFTQTRIEAEYEFNSLTLEEFYALILDIEFDVMVLVSEMNDE